MAGVVMRKNMGINLESDVVVAVDKMAAKLGWSRSRTVNWILRQGIEESSNVLEGIKGMTLEKVLELLAGHGAKKKLK